MLGLAASLSKGGASLLTFVKDNLKLYLDFKSSRSDTLAFPSEGSTSFDASTEIIKVGQSNSIITGNEVTLSCWFKSEAYNNERGYLIQNQKGAGSTNITVQIHGNDGTASSGYIGGLVWNGSSAHSWTTVDGSVDDGKWHHVAFTSTATTQKVYLDGVLKVTETNTFSNSASTDATIIGNDGANNFPFTGKMANVAIWNRVLSPEEVQSVMNKSYSQLGSVEKTSLISWWALDQNELTAIHLDGADDKLENTSFTTHQTNTGTISGWFIFNDLTSTQRFFGVGGNTSTGTNRSLQVSSASLSFIGYGADWDTTADLSVGQLYHLAVTWNGDDIVVYVNGTGYSQTLASLTTPTGTNIRIGASVWQDQDDAHIKSISASVYTATLSASEVQSIYNNGYEVSEVGNNNIAHYWVMNNGSTVTDLVGSKNLTVTNGILVTNARQLDSKSTNHGVTIGATTTTSVYGGNAPILPRAIDIAESFADKIGNGSALFNGSSDYIRIAHSTDLSTPKGFTITAWIKADSDVTDWRGIVAKRNATNSSNYLIYVNKTTGVLGSYDTSTELLGATALNDNTWHHVAISNDSSNTVMYVNGIVDKTGTQSAYATNTLDVVIGEAGWNGSAPPGDKFLGNIASVGIWQGVLTQTQIQSVMESTSYAKIPADVKSTLGTSLFDAKPNIKDNWTLYSNNERNNTDNGVVITRPVGTGDSRGALYTVSGASSNKLYKLQYDGYYVGTDTTMRIVYQVNGVNNYGEYLTTTSTTYTHYFIYTGTTYLLFNNMDAGNSIYIENISLKEVTNDLVAYYPLDADSSANGVTNDVTTGETLGSNLVDANTSSGWVDNGDGSTISNITNGVSIADDSSWSDIAYLSDSSILTTNLTVGKVYKITFDAYKNLGGAFIKVNDGANNINVTITTINTTYTVYIISAHATSGSIRTGDNESGGIVYITNLSVKEVTSNTGVLK